MRKKPLKAWRPLPVRRPEMVHKSPVDYDRKDNIRVIDQELSEMDEEEDMGKDFTRAKEMAQRIYEHVTADGVRAARVIETEPPVIEVFDITDEILKITVDVE